MRTRLFALAAVCCLALPVAHAADKPAHEPSVVVRLKSFDGLVSDVKYLAKATGNDDAANQIDGVLQALPQNPAGIGMDTKKPIGLYAFITPGGTDSSIVTLVPISDEKKFLDALDGFNVGATKGKDGIYSLDVPGSPVSIYLAFSKGYAYVAINDKAPLASDVRLDPVKVLAGDAATVIGAKLDLASIPAEAKQLALGQFENQMADQKEKKVAGESPEQAKQREQGVDAAIQIVRMVVNDGGPIGLQLDVDQTKGEVGVQGSLAGVANSGLAGIIGVFGNAKTLFGGVRADALNVNVNAQVPAIFKLLLNAAIDSGIKEAISKEKDVAKREATGNLLKAVAPTLKAGEIDLAIAIRGPKNGAKFGLLAALKVKNGKKIESAVKDAASQAPEAEKKALTFDAGDVAGVKYHQIQAGEMDKNAKRMFGDSPKLHVAFRDDAVFLALGGDTMGLLKQGIESQPASASLFRVEGSVGRLAPLDENADPRAGKVAKEVFGADPKGTDTMALVVEGGPALKLRLVLKTKTLLFFNKMKELEEDK